MTTGLISNIQKYSIHDGPGIRTTVFMKGCPLLCAWCHNPETQVFLPEIVWYKDKCIGCRSCLEACPEQALALTEKGVSLDMEKCTRCGKCAAACPTLAMERLGQEMTVEELLAEVAKDEPFYEQSKGGVTLSGGEPLSQAEFAAEFLRACKDKGYHTTVDTSGFVPQRVFEQVLPYVDLFLYDVKHLDNDQHEKYMKAPNEAILRNLRWLAARHANIWVRVPLIPSVNDDPQHIKRIGELTRELGLREIYLLPYHKMAQAKYKRLRLPYTLPMLEDPTEEEMAPLAQILSDLGLNVHIGG